jgi:hypothetical protein
MVEYLPRNPHLLSVEWYQYPMFLFHQAKNRYCALCAAWYFPP